MQILLPVFMILPCSQSQIWGQSVTTAQTVGATLFAQSDASLQSILEATATTARDLAAWTGVPEASENAAAQGVNASSAATNRTETVKEAGAAAETGAVGVQHTGAANGANDVAGGTVANGANGTAANGDGVGGWRSSFGGVELPTYVFVGETLAPEIEQIPDSMFYARAGRVIYPVNSIVLDENSELCRELAGSVLPMAQREGWKLRAIEIRGAASPEGPYDNNCRLANKRAEAVYNFITREMGQEPTVAPSSVNIPEDYYYLLWLMENAGDEAAPVLRGLIERYGNDARSIKQALRQVNGGALWLRLYAEYYKKLRSGCIMLYFTTTLTEPTAVADATIATDLQRELPQLTLPLFEHPAIEYRERPHMLSLSSNLLYDAFYMPNFGWAPMLNINAEFYPRHGNFTFRAGFTSPYYHRWSRQKFFQIRDYHLEVRRYFNPGTLHTGAYVAAFVNANKYGIGFNAKKGWEGEGFGGSLKLGYVVPLGSGRWRLDFHVAAGGYITRFDPYVYGNPLTGEVDDDYYYDYIGPIGNFKRRNHQRTWFGPTEIGITLSFDLIYYRLARKGVSCHRKEVVGL